jgi:hypothetical protein
MKWLNRFWAAVGPMPSTNVRIFVTLGIWVGTALRYQASGLGIGPIHFAAWEPSGEWLMSLVAMSGVDVAQFAVKRKTHDETKGKKEAVPDGD